MKVSACLMIVVCTMSLFVRAQDDSESAVRSKIIALEKAWNQAYKAADIRALDSILDNEIVLINDDGSVQSKAEFLAGVKATRNNSQEQQVSPESMSVHVFGNTAISTGVFRAKGVEGGKSYVRRGAFRRHLAKQEWQVGLRRQQCHAGPTLTNVGASPRSCGRAKLD